MCVLFQIIELYFWKWLARFEKVFLYFLPWNLFSIISPLSSSWPHSSLVSAALPSNKEISQTYFASVVSRMFFLIFLVFPFLGQFMPLMYFFVHFIFHLSPFLWIPSILCITQFSRKKKNNLTNITFFQWVSSIFWTMICALRTGSVS